MKARSALIAVGIAAIVAACSGGTPAGSATSGDAAGSAAPSAVASAPAITASAAASASAASSAMASAEASTAARPFDAAVLAAGADKLAAHQSYAIHCEGSNEFSGDELVTTVDGLQRGHVTLATPSKGVQEVVWWQTDPKLSSYAAVKPDGTYDRSSPVASQVTLNWQTGCSLPWLWGLVSRSLGSGTVVGQETKNGTPATHVSFTPPKGTADMWFADADGAVVALETSDGTKDMAIEISRLDDPAISVDIPKK